MPKLPLFKDEPLNQGIIVALEEIRDHPEVGDNVAILSDLAALRQNPKKPMSERLAFFCIDKGLLGRSVLDNFIISTSGIRTLRGIRASMRLEINQRLLAHVEMSGSPGDNIAPRSTAKDGNSH